MALPSLRILTVDEQYDIVMAYLRQRACMGEINILEAGCGRKWCFDLQGVRYKLTGVDIDKDALEFRKQKEKDLHEAILGDLRHVVLMPGAYDVIYNSFVLEHVEGAEQVLERFLTWLKPDGLLIITIPDRDSVYGFFASHTPYWVHIFFYRYVLGDPNAGKPGHAPYPTFYDKIVSRERIREFAWKNQLEIREECGFYKPRGLVGLIINFIHFLSLGHFASSHCNLMYVLEKRVPRALP
jgi:SAM-dependent methyltransferase